MSETSSLHNHRPLAYDWDHRFEEAAERPNVSLVVIEGGQPQPVDDTELEQHGLGHIVTTAAVPTQRKPPPEESIPVPEMHNQAPQPLVPDTSYYLG